MHLYLIGKKLFCLISSAIEEVDPRPFGPSAEFTLSAAEWAQGRLCAGIT